VPGLDGSLSTTLNIVVLLTILTLAPSILILCTCFTRMVIVFGLLRQALGTQSLPPGQVIVGLSLFLTFVVMAPSMERMYDEGIRKDSKDIGFNLAPNLTGSLSDVRSWG
jgi:flagellar biosynthetic protein FliP